MADQHPDRENLEYRDTDYFSERGNKSLDSLPVPPPVPVNEPMAPVVPEPGTVVSTSSQATPPTDFDG